MVNFCECDTIERRKKEERVRYKNYIIPGKRVILGEAKRTAGGSSEYGLWVSKPGVDVINTSNQVLLLLIKITIKYL